MGMQPTDAQIDEIIDLAISLSADSSEVAQYIEKMQQGPTKEERDAIAKAEAERKAKEEAKRKAEAERKAKEEAERKAKEEAKRKAEAERKAKEEAERKAKAEAERKADAERKAKEEAKRKAEAERKAKEEAERKAKEEAKRKVEAERKAKEEAERKAKEEAKRKAEAERKAKEAAERAQREKEEAERTNGHEYVDFGLPFGTLWATCNIGASSPEQYGDLFAWGETQTKKEFKLSNHKHSKGFLGIFSDATTKYKVDEECTQLELEDDAARAQWGGAWEMPTDADFQELFLFGNVEAATINGIAGLRVSRNGKSIFFPKAGAEGFGSFAKKGEAGRYWTSSTNTEKKGDTYVITDDSAAESMHLYGNKAEVEDCIMRYCGLSIRPVIHNYKSRNI